MAKVVDAYQKMFEDGSAFKPIKIQQPSPDNEGGRSGGPMGESEEIDYSLFDNHMKGMIEDKIEAKKSGKNLMMENKSRSTKTKVSNKQYKELKNRVALLEQALQLVMETQTKLLKESNKDNE